MTELHSRKDYYFLASVGFAAVLLLVTLLLPLGFDNDVYQSMGWTLYAYHGLPYLASWDMNFPGIVFVHWTSIALFGSSDFGFRLFDYFAHIAIVILYYFVLRRWLTKRECLIAIIIYSIYYPAGQWGLAGERDEYAVFFLLAATLILLGFFDSNALRRHSISVAGIATFSIGLFCGIVFLLRPTYVFFSFSFAALLLMETARVVRGKKALNFCIMSIGAILPLAAVIILYAFQPHGLEQLYYSVIRFNLDVYSGIDVPKSFFTIGRGPVYVVAAAGLFFLLRSKKGFFVSDISLTLEKDAVARRDRMMLYLFAASSILSPIIMGKYFTYHFSPFMIISIGFASIGLSRMAEFISRPILRRYGIIFALLLFAAIYYPRHLVRIFALSIGGKHPLERTYEAVIHDSSYGIRAQKNVVSYIDSKMPRNMPVEFASFYPSLEWRLGRPSASRFTTLIPLMPLSHGVPDYIKSWQHEFIDSLASVRPRYIIRSSLHVWWPFARAYEDSSTHAVPGFDSLIAADYERDTIIGGFILYRIRQQAK